MSHFHHEQAVGRQVIGRFGDDRPHEIESVASTRERERRLVPILGRQATHRRFGDVRRVGQDDVVTATSQFFEEIGSHERHAIA